MSIFKKNEPQPAKLRERPVHQPRTGSADGAISIIGYGMSVIGDITTEGIVRVEGEVKGTIRAAKSVILGQGGVVNGNVFTDDAVIGGTVHGSIEAGNRVELQSTSTVHGEIRARAEHLKLEEGARFTGQIHMLDEVEGTRATALLSAVAGAESGATKGTAASLPSGNNLFASSANASSTVEKGANTGENDSAGLDQKKKNAGV